MALSLQRKLELAGDLAKVQPMLVRLHLIEKPKKRRPVRYLVLAGGLVAVGTVVAAIALRRQRGRTGTSHRLHGFAQTGPVTENPGA